MRRANGAAWRAAASLVLAAGVVIGAGAQDPPLSREDFAAVARMPRGSERADAIARGLANVAASERGERLALAFPAFQEEIAAGALQDAETIAVAMHAAEPAPWSAATLGLLWTRMGKYEEADRLLSAEIDHQQTIARENEGRARAAADESARTQALAVAAAARLERRALLERRAVSRTGAGHEARALDDLGRALAEGGRDAAQMLAQRALAAGRREEALSLFRSLLQPRPGEDLDPLGESVPWAARGWGLALLQPPSQAPTGDVPTEARRNP